jgi:hypothetical protein
MLGIVRSVRGSRWQSVCVIQQRKTEMTINPIVKKLGLKPGMRILIMNAPPCYMDLLTPLPDVVVVLSSKDGSYSFVQFFAVNLSQISKSISGLLKHMAPGALLWVTYPKKILGIESDLSREVVCEALDGTGWVPVSIVAIDEVWSALRFRPAEDVKSRQPRSKKT